jgi:chaperonin GroES
VVKTETENKPLPPVKPQRDLVVLQRVIRSKSAGGILLPDNFSRGEGQKISTHCRIISVGPGAKDKDGKLVKVEYKPGQDVVIGMYAGNSVRLDGFAEVLIVRSDDILAVLDLDDPDE